MSYITKIPVRGLKDIFGGSTENCSPRLHYQNPRKGTETWIFRRTIGKIFYRYITKIPVRGLKPPNKFGQPY